MLRHKNRSEVNERRSRPSSLLRNVLIGLLSGTVIVGVTAVPTMAAPAADWSSKPLVTSAPRDLKHGGASELADAFAEARAGHKKVEIVSKRGIASTSYANPDGTITQVLAAAPIRAKNSSGALVPIDESLTERSGRLLPSATSAKVSFRASAAVATTAPPAASSSAPSSSAPSSAGAATGSPDLGSAAGAGVTSNLADLDLPGAADISLGFNAALPEPDVDGATATYAIDSSASLETSSLNDGFAADIVLTATPQHAPVYAFPLKLTGGLTPRLADGVLQFIDEAGHVVALSRPLQMWDAQRDAGGDPSNSIAVDSKLIKDGDAWTLEMTPSLSWLTASSTKYPVTVDPTVVTTDNADTWYYSGNTTDHGADYNLLVGLDSGKVYRSYMTWNTAPFTGKTVTNASLSLFQYEAGSCDSRLMKIYPTTTYSSADSKNVKTNTDSAWDQSPAQNTGGAGCSTPNAYVSMDLTKIVSGWTTGEVPQYGMQFQAGSESDSSYARRFCSRNPAPSGTGHCEGTSGMPQLSVTYVYDLGVKPHGGTLINHRLNDHSQFGVNTANGDGVYRSTDLHFNGRGLDLSIDRFYDSLGNRDSQFGPNWFMSVGTDVRLNRGSSGNDRWDYVSPGGVWFGRFARKTSGDTNSFYSPTFGGIDADLKDNGDGTYTMTFHSSQEKYVFDTFNCSTCNGVLKSDTDRDGNVISYGYDSSSHQLTSITDTHGRILTVHHNGSGYIDSISESGSYTNDPRTWTYHYNGNQLDYTVDPTGARTDYSYSGGQLTTITDPAQASGNRPTTTISYNNGQTTGVAYSSNATGGSKQFTYNYSSDTAAAQSACSADDSWTRFTTVTNVSDPQGGTTKYCFKDPSKTPSPTDPNGDGSTNEKIRVVDGDGHHRSSTFTPDLAAQNSTGQSNDGVTGGSTVYTYNTNNTLSSATAPKDSSGSKTAGSNSFDYATSSSVAGATFLPSSVGTSSSSCSSIGYDSRGNLTDTWTGQAATSGKSTCSGAKSGRHAHVDYNDYGSPKSAYSPTVASLSSIAEADKTRYFYYDTEPNKGELQRLVKPGSDGTCTSDRTGCTSYTYDGYSRVATTTDGNNNTTSYSYDRDDRITQVLTGSATSCSPSQGTCIKYSYDAEGNLSSRVDRNGTTTFTYDWLNNPSTQSQPNGTALATVYDGAGNLTRYSQTLPGQSTDTVNYAYDAANQLTSITDAVGTFTYTSNADGRPTKLTFPSGYNLAISFDYTGSGKLKSVTPSNSELPAYTYDYSTSTGDSAALRKTTNRDGSSVTYSYDTANRLSTADASSGTDYTYTYDADSNIRSAAAGSLKTYYGYNETDQLCWSGSTDSSSASMGRTCAASPSGDITYTSDRAGQSLGPSAGPIHYNSQSQVDQISSPAGSGPVSQTYLDQGNNLRLTAGNDTFTDGTKLGVTARTTSGAATYYTRDPSGQLIDEHGASGTYGYLTDRIGSVTAVINTSGGLAGSYSYDPYGKTTVNSGSSNTAAQNNPWRYTGAYQNPIDGYYKLGARFYDAAGHFTQADSVGGSIARAEQYNGYSYTSGDPINNTDLSGNAVNWKEILGQTVSAASAFVLGTAFAVAISGLCVAATIACILAAAAGAGIVAVLSDKAGALASDGDFDPLQSFINGVLGGLPPV